MAKLYPQMDTYLSYRVVCQQVDHAVKMGKLSREEAKDIIDGARESYRNQNYNRQLSRRGMLKGDYNEVHN